MINIGIIGLGLGERCLIRKFSLLPGTRIISLMSKSKEHAMEVAQKYNIDSVCESVEEMLSKKLDLICIASPNREHYIQILKAVKANVNILCEKPMCETFDKVKECINLLKKKNLIFFMDYQLRFNPYFIKIKSLLDQMGKIGSMRMLFESNLYNSESIESTWNLKADEGGGVINAIMPHFLDLMMFWFPDIEIRDLYANTYAFKEDAEEICSVNAISKKHMNLNMFVSAVNRGENRFEVEIIGEKGSMYFSIKEGLFYNGQSIKVDFSDIHDPNESIFRNSFGYYSKYIIDKLRGETNQNLETNYSEIIYNHWILEKIKESAKANMLLNISK